MNYQLIPKELRPIAEKVEAQQRISEGDALTLYGTNDLNALGIIANVVRERKNGNYATYIHNRYINYSNICILSCQFCAFAAKKRDAHAFEYAIDEIVQAVTDALPLGVTEVHMVGGLHPTLKKDWYLDLLRRLRALDPQLHIKAFPAPLLLRKRLPQWLRPRSRPPCKRKRVLPRKAKKRTVERKRLQRRNRTCGFSAVFSCGPAGLKTVPAGFLFNTRHFLTPHVR